MSECIRFQLPWPPSVNHYWKSFRGRTYVSAAGKRYAVDVQAAVLSLGYKRMDGRLAVSVTAFPPDRRRRDLDNTLKATLDSLTKAGLWNDDEQIDDLRVVRGPCDSPDGSIEVEVRRLP